jgi:uncharacterized caspase-like protein
MQFRPAFGHLTRIRATLFTVAASLFLATAALADGRVALVVGVAAYVNAPALRNTTNDAAAIGAALKRLGFDTDIVLDPNKNALDAAVRRFGERAAGADVALFYYAGHALEAGGKDWIIPTSAAITKSRDLPYETFDVDVLMDQLDGAARLSVIILDACRDNPFRTRIGDGRGLGGPGGLAQLRAAAGSLIEFATAPGTVAADGTGAHSPFTAALLHQIEIPGQEAHKTFAEVRREVREATNGRQTPWEASAMEGDFYFKPLPSAAPAKTVAATVAAPLDASGTAPPPTASDEAELLFWRTIIDSNDPADFREYLAKFPKGLFAGVAANRIRKIEGAVPAPTATPEHPPSGEVQPQATVQAAERREVQDKDTLRTHLLAELTSMPEGLRKDRVATFLDAKWHRMFAVTPDRKGSYYSGDWGSPEQAERVGLEQCQVFNGFPCILLAVDQFFVIPQGQSERPRRDMPRIHYAGQFDPAQIPAIAEGTRELPVVSGYRSAPGAKAMAIHSWGRIFVSTGMSDQRSAEEAALDNCNDDPYRWGRDGPCMLYAVGNQVVFAERRIDPGNSDASYKRITEALARVAPAIASERIAYYSRQTEPKAIAVHTESAQAFAAWGTYVESRATAETEALEGCQQSYGSPCVLLAVGTELKSADPASAPKRDMPRLHATGRFVPASVPFVTSRTASELQTYLSLPGAKAIAIRASHTGLGVASGAKTVAEAEQKALAACNASEPEYPCFVYTSGDQIAFPERRTEAVKRTP